MILRGTHAADCSRREFLWTSRPFIKNMLMLVNLVICKQNTGMYVQLRLENVRILTKTLISGSFMNIWVFPKIGITPKWMVKIMENLVKNG